jgi:hypothetical protein
MPVETDLVESVSEVAVTVTLLPEGIATGAVYVVPASLVVVVELNEPHAVEPQVTVHCTRGLAVTSLAIAASSEADVLT